MDTSSDIIVGLALKIAALSKRRDQLEGHFVAGKNSVAAGYCEAEESDLGDRIRMLTDAVSCLEANSVEGAIYQLMLGCELVEEVTSDGDMPKWKAEKYERQGRRLYFSAVRALRGNGVAVDQMGPHSYYSENLDPWRPYETRIEEMEWRDRKQERKAAERRKAEAA